MAELVWDHEKRDRILDAVWKHPEHDEGHLGDAVGEVLDKAGFDESALSKMLQDAAGDRDAVIHKIAEQFRPCFSDTTTIREHFQVVALQAHKPIPPKIVDAVKSHVDAVLDESEPDIVHDEELSQSRDAAVRAASSVTKPRDDEEMPPEPGSNKF